MFKNNRIDGVSRFGHQLGLYHLFPAIVPAPICASNSVPENAQAILIANEVKHERS